MCHEGLVEVNRRYILVQMKERYIWYGNTFKFKLMAPILNLHMWQMPIGLWSKDESLTLRSDKLPLWSSPLSSPPSSSDEVVEVGQVVESLVCGVATSVGLPRCWHF